MDRSSLKIQGTNLSYNDVKEEVTAYINDRIAFWNNYVASDESEMLTLVAVELHGSRLRNQAREDSDLDVVFEYKGKAREDDVFNFFNYDEDEEPYTIDGFVVDFNPITVGKSGDMESYMERSDEYDHGMQSVQESIKLLTDNDYIIEGIVGKALATGALAAGMAFGNSGVKTHAVQDSTLDFGKNTTVHIQDRHDLPQTRFGVPKSFKLKDGTMLKQMNHKDEVAWTKKKILATPAKYLSKEGKRDADLIANLMTRAANKYNLDVDILLAIAGAESAYKDTTSEDDARGMMQITNLASFDHHVRLMGKDTLSYKFDGVNEIRRNIEEAARIVADLSVRRNNIIEMIFASYNGGTKQATAWRHAQNSKPKTRDGKKAPKLDDETRDYVTKCMYLYKFYKTIKKE